MTFREFLLQEDTQTQTKWAYHLSYQEDLPSIAKNGLLTSTEDPWGSGLTGVIFFTDVCGRELGPSSGEDSAWLRFPFPEDASEGIDEFTTRTPVPSSQIQILLDLDGTIQPSGYGGKWAPLKSVVKESCGQRRVGVLLESLDTKP